MLPFEPPNIESLKAKGKINGLINALFYKKDWYIRQEAAIALGELGDPIALDPLIVLLGESNKSVRQAEAYALVRLFNTASLSNQQKQSVLNQRRKISQQHEDGSLGNHINIDHSKGDRYETGHEDKTDYVNQEIGVDIPL